jgi:hypothetical protein
MKLSFSTIFNWSKKHRKKNFFFVEREKKENANAPFNAVVFLNIPEKKETLQLN